MNWLLIYAISFSVIVYIVLRILERWILPRLYISDVTLEEKERQLRKQVEELERRLKESEKKNQSFEDNQSLLLKQLREATVKINNQQHEIGSLIDKVRELERTAPITPVETKPYSGRVLGIWPDSLPLNIMGEKNAIANTGLEYEALEGLLASREGIVEQLGLREYNILEIGAKGGSVGIKLSDGIAPASWWSQLARQHHIDIFVVLTNESSKPGVENIADSLFNAGVKHVISVDNAITDVDAVKFARMFYRRLSRGLTIVKAFEYAKLVLSDIGSDTIKLRERK